MTGLFFGIPVATAFAEEIAPITDTQLVQIQTHCSEIKTALKQAHASDAIVRVNRGKLYERLSTKLMAPLNSRIALNRLDGTALLRVTSEYEKHLRAFRTSYQAYEEKMSELISINCTKQPAHFYNVLEDVRVRRGLVRENTETLARDVARYKTAFDEFASPYRGASQ